MRIISLKDNPHFCSQSFSINAEYRDELNALLPLKKRNT
jgi:hypothetical protein